MGPITRGSKHLNLTALIWHQSRGPMPVMIPKHSSCEKGLSENQSQECYEVCCKGTESTCHWIMFDVYGTFSIVDNVPEFRKSSSVNFIRIKDSRPSKAVVSRNALKWVFIQILSVSQSDDDSDPDSMSVDCWSESRQNMAQVWPKTPAKDFTSRLGLASDHFKAEERLLNISLRLFLDQMILG